MDLDEAVQRIVASSDAARDAAQAAETAAREATTASREATTAANGATAAANATTSAIGKLQHGQALLRIHVDSLWERTFGEKPPMPGAGIDPTTEAMTRWSSPPLVTLASDASDQASSTSLELAALEGRMISGFAGIQQEIRGTIVKELTAQSKAMGLGAKGWDYVLSKEGLRQVIRVTGALAAIVAAIGAIAAGCRAPTPPAPTAPPTMIIMPALPAHDGGFQ
jgi:multidrug efflux pump subunit AcrA (membrane-fusion protein)